MTCAIRKLAFAPLLLIVLLFQALLPTGASSAPRHRALVLIDASRPTAAAELLDARITVVREFGRRLVAFADETDIATIEQLGFRYKILDSETSGKTYYTVFLGDEERARAAESRVTILERDGLQAVVRATPEEAVRLAAAGVEIAMVFPTPMRAAPVVGPMYPQFPVEADPLIQEMVNSVSIARINARVQRLQDFVTRYSAHDSCLAAAYWIRSQFESFGIDSVEFHQWSAQYHPNVVAVIPGRAHPERNVIIGGHYDSVTFDHNHCPGADDNASGTACVLECAEILSQYEFDYTITLIAFSGEEEGLLGSEAYAREAADRGDIILGMIAVDMIGYLAPGDQLDLDIIDNASSAWLRDRVMTVGSLYVPELLIVQGSLTSGSSDHSSFWRHGYDAVMFFEDSKSYSPYIHTLNDVVGVSYMNPTLAERSVKTAVAVMANLAVPFRIGIQHTPLAHTTDEVNPHRVAAQIFATQPLAAGSLLLHYTLSTGGGWTTLTLTPTGNPDEYEAFIPPQIGGTVVDYYLSAEDVSGAKAYDPAGAPAELHTFAVGTLATVLNEEFEIESGWTAGAPGDNAAGGIWEWCDPNGTYLSGALVQPEDDHTPDPGRFCFITGNSPPGSPQDQNDVDGGKTTLLSPVYDLSSYPNAWASYHRWYTNDTGSAPGMDAWIVDVSPDAGVTWVRLETDWKSRRMWTLVERDLLHYIPLTAQVQFRFIASDEGAGSIVEAGVDDFGIVTYQSAMTAVLPGRSVPGVLSLQQNVPNPFNPETSIRFTVPSPGAIASLKIYDVAGHLVTTLVDGEKTTGSRTVRWNGMDRNGRDVPSGVYFCLLTAGEKSLSRKLVLLR